MIRMRNATTPGPSRSLLSECGFCGTTAATAIKLHHAAGKARAWTRSGIDFPVGHRRWAAHCRRGQTLRPVRHVLLRNGDRKALLVCGADILTD